MTTSLTESPRRVDTRPTCLQNSGNLPRLHVLEQEDVRRHVPFLSWSVSGDVSCPRLRRRWTLFLSSLIVRAENRNCEGSVDHVTKT